MDSKAAFWTGALTALALFAPASTVYKVVVASIATGFLSYAFLRHFWAQLRRRRAFIKWSVGFVLCGLVFSALSYSWLASTIVSPILSGFIYAALVLWLATPAERPLNRAPRSLVDEYVASGNNLPYMKKRYGGYLYEVEGDWLRPRGGNKHEGWLAELDCGVSRKVYEAVWVIFELTDAEPPFWDQARMRVRGRIESFEGYNIILGKSKLYT